MARVWAGRQLVPAHLRGKRARARVARQQRDALTRNDLKSWRRASAVLQCLDGKSLVQIADGLGVHNSAVSKWLAGYVDRGFDALVPRKAPGQKPRLNARQMQHVAHVVEQGPEKAGFACGVWTARMVAEYIQRRFDVTYSWKYVPELLHRLGFSVQRPRRRLSRADQEAQEYWLRVRLPQIKKTPMLNTA